MEPAVASLKDFIENTLFYINQDFAVIKNGKSQRRGKVGIGILIFSAFCIKFAY